jgi:hypothetical protein
VAVIRRKGNPVGITTVLDIERNAFCEGTFLERNRLGEVSVNMVKGNLEAGVTAWKKIPLIRL